MLSQVQLEHWSKSLSSVCLANELWKQIISQHQFDIISRKRTNLIDHSLDSRLTVAGKQMQRWCRLATSLGTIPSCEDQKSLYRMGWPGFLRAPSYTERCFLVSWTEPKSESSLWPPPPWHRDKDRESGGEGIISTWKLNERDSHLMFRSSSWAAELAMTKRKRPFTPIQ